LPEELVDVVAPDFRALADNQIPEPSSMRDSQLYGVHAYWAKKPWNVVAKFISHFSNKGDVVLDPFAGVGVTAIEALRLGRKAVAVDICPLSVFITRMLATPYSGSELDDYAKMMREIQNNVEDRIQALYATRCPKNDKHIAHVREARYDCQNNAENLTKRVWKLKEIRFVCDRHEKPLSGWRRPQEGDLELVAKLDREEPSEWYPKDKLPLNTRINVYEGMKVGDLYTKRNLHAMAILRKEIFDKPCGKISDLVKFTLSSSLHLMRMTDYKRASPQNFYVPKENMTELNVWTVFYERMADIMKSKEALQNSRGYKFNEAKDFSELQNGDANCLIRKWDATRLTDLVGEQSIDYIHTDPPYADQVPYMEITMPWIAWLGLESDLSEWQRQLEAEIILSDSPERPSKKKGTPVGDANYNSLLHTAIGQMNKALKPNHWVSVWYCCEREEYWRAITDSFKKVGLEEKKRFLILRPVKTFKYNVERARNPLGKVLENDLLVSCQKTGKSALIIEIPANIAKGLWLRVAEREIRRQGSVTTGEIYIEFVKAALDKYGNPPPNLRYEEFLLQDRRFAAQKVKEKVGKAIVDTTKWTLKDVKDLRKLTSYA